MAQLARSTSVRRLEKRRFVKKREKARSAGAWLSLVERFAWDEEVVGSNPAAPTIFFSLTRLKFDILH